MTEVITILLKAFWCGIAAVGFGILFNVPKKSLAEVWIGGVIVGLVKFSVLKFLTPSIIFASFLAAIMVGVYSMILAIIRREPPMLYAIPSVIPLVPGVFAYKTMFGLIKLSNAAAGDYSTTLADTAHNGALTLFIIMAFTIGIIIPYEIGKNISKRSGDAKTLSNTTTPK